MSSCRILVSPRTSVRRRMLIVASAALAIVVVHVNPAQVHAQSGTWSSAGVSSWNNTARWTGGVVAGGTNNTATFTVGGTASLLSNIVLGNLTTGATRVQIRSGTQANYVDLTNEQIEFATTSGVPAITNAGRLDMFAIIAGSQGLTKAGAGTMYLNRPNTYTGVTTITTGQVRLAQNNGLGDSSVGNGTVIQSGAQLRLDNASTSSGVTGIQTNEPFTIAGDGVSNLGALRSEAGTGNAFNGPITLSANASIKAAAVAPLTLGGAINVGSNTLSLDDSGAFTVSGAIAGTGNLSYTGTGGLSLSGVNTLTGTTTVTNSGAPVVVNGYLAGLMNFTGVSGRNLIGSGTFAGGLFVGNAAVLAPGAAVAADYNTLTSSALEVQSATVSLGIQNASTYDRLVMTAGSGGLTLGGTTGLTLDFASLLPNSSSLQLLNFTGLTGNWQTVGSTGAYAGSWTQSGDVWSLGNVGTGGSQTLSFTQSTGVLAVVPEPSTLVLLGGVAAAAGLTRLRRRMRR